MASPSPASGHPSAPESGTGLGFTGAAGITGLTAAEVAEREAAGLVNVQSRDTSRSLGQILRVHVFTLFNLAIALCAGALAAVLATGADRPYPARSRVLHERIAATGCVVSELPPGTPPRRWAFPARNRLIAALSAGTLVVEGGERSGSLITADFAADVAAGTTSIRVDAGRGAYVLSGDWSDESAGAPFLMDAKGQAYRLVGVGAAEQLGYGSVDAPVVPDTWVQLFRPGVALSQDAALCPPTREPGATSCE